MYRSTKHLASARAWSTFARQSSPFLISSARKISSLGTTIPSAAAKAWAAGACSVLWLRNTVVIPHLAFRSEHQRFGTPTRSTPMTLQPARRRARHRITMRSPLLE